MSAASEVRLTNVDEALTRKVDPAVHPDRFLGDDTDAEEVDAATAEIDRPEATENTEGHGLPRYDAGPRTVRTAVKHPLAIAIMAEMPLTVPVGLTWGAPTGTFLPEAHAVGEALRRERRQHRPPEAQPPADLPECSTVLYCDGCGRYVAGWHACYRLRSGELRIVSDVDVNAYYEQLAETLAGLKGGKPRPVGPDEWRAVPGSEGRYEMNGETQQVRRNAYTTTLPNGSKRSYKAAALTPRNGSYSLSIGGQNVSRGIYALWAEVFPDYAGPKPTPLGQWADPIKLRHDIYLDNGIGEWVDSGVLIE